MRLKEEQDAELQRLGWHQSRDSMGYSISTKVQEDRFVEMVWQSYQSSKTIVLPILVRIGLISQREVFRIVTGRKKTEYAPVRQTLLVTARTLNIAKIQEVSTKALSLLQQNDPANHISQKCQKRPAMSECQYEFISALAWKGALEDLILERQMCEMPSSPGHRIAIPAAAIDRAIKVVESKPINKV